MPVRLIIRPYLTVAYSYCRILRIAERNHNELDIGSVVVPFHLLCKHQRVCIVALGEEGAILCIKLLGVYSGLEIVPEIEHIPARVTFNALGELLEGLEGEIPALIPENLRNYRRHHITGSKVKQLCISYIESCSLGIMIEHIFVQH